MGRGDAVGEQVDWRTNARLNERVVEETGERHCRSCDHFRKTEGGRWRVASNGRRIWRCKACANRQNGAGFR